MENDKLAMVLLDLLMIGIFIGGVGLLLLLIGWCNRQLKNDE